MDKRNLYNKLKGIPLGGFQFFDHTGSTNDVALAWAAEGAHDLSLVYAEAQSAGRGRGERHWFTGAGTGLAFSLVLRPLAGEAERSPLFSGLGALAVCTALERLGIHPGIKWPNDVLLNQKKVCGILVETVWIGEKADSIVLGIGLNVTPEAIPVNEDVLFPATSLEIELRKQVDRAALLKDILQALIHWRERMLQADFMQAWEARLSFRGEHVELQRRGSVPLRGQIAGLGFDGSLLLRDSDGVQTAIQFGEVHLRPVV